MLYYYDIKWLQGLFAYLNHTLKCMNAFAYDNKYKVLNAKQDFLSSLKVFSDETFTVFHCLRRYVYIKKDVFKSNLFIKES